MRIEFTSAGRREQRAEDVPVRASGRIQLVW
jgi:hypothetical protein